MELVVDSADGDESTVVDTCGDCCRDKLAGELVQRFGDVPPALAGVESRSPNNWSVITSFCSIAASQSASAWSLALLVTSTFSSTRTLPMASIPATLLENKVLERLGICQFRSAAELQTSDVSSKKRVIKTGPIQRLQNHNSFVKCYCINFAMLYLLLMATLRL